LKTRIEERINYLVSLSEEDEEINSAKAKENAIVLKELLDTLQIESNPLIGLSDDGFFELEWRTENKFYIMKICGKNDIKFLAIDIKDKHEN